MTATPLAAPATRQLPQLGGQLFLTDGGIETTLLYHDGIDLACFAAIDMFRKPGGRAHLERYFEGYLAIAREAGTGFVIESATCRACRVWAVPLEVAVCERGGYYI